MARKSILIAALLIVLPAGFAAGDQEKALKLYEKGYRLFSEGKNDEAIETLTLALAEDPALYLAEHALGGAFVAKKEYEAAARRLEWATAVSALRRAARLLPRSAEVARNLGLALIGRAGEEEDRRYLSAAAESLRRSMELDSRQADLRKVLADVDRRLAEVGEDDR